MAVLRLVADSKQAFLNIEINERDKDFFRFLWFNDIYKKPRKSTIKCVDVEVTLNFLQKFYVDDNTSTFNLCETCLSLVKVYISGWFKFEKLEKMM